ncbi:MAG: hypothetical protein LV468_05755, partial [Candidatus Nitrosotenuis sp.]|nr:hypothetical protein [Candidatus Nitrosotenuis sp.]
NSSGTKLHMIIMQNTIDAKKLLENHSEKTPAPLESKSEFDRLLEDETPSYPVGGENSELDALLGDILQEKH